MDRRQEFCIERNQSLRTENPAASFVILYCRQNQRRADTLSCFPLPARSGERIKVRGSPACKVPCFPDLLQRPYSHSKRPAAVSRWSVHSPTARVVSGGGL